MRVEDQSTRHPSINMCNHQSTLLDPSRIALTCDASSLTAGDVGYVSMLAVLRSDTVNKDENGRKVERVHSLSVDCGTFQPSVLDSILRFPLSSTTTQAKINTDDRALSAESSTSSVSKCLCHREPRHRAKPAIWESYTGTRTLVLILRAVSTAQTRKARVVHLDPRKYTKPDESKH